MLKALQSTFELQRKVMVLHFMPESCIFCGTRGGRKKKKKQREVRSRHVKIIVLEIPETYTALCSLQLPLL